MVLETGKIGGLYDVLVDEYTKALERQKLGAKEKIAPELARRGIFTSPVAQQTYTDIEKYYADIFNQKLAELMLQRAKEETELEKWLKQFQFGQEQFAWQKQQAEKELEQFEKQYNLYREALRKQQEEWWKPALGTAIGIGGGIGLGALAKWGVGKLPTPA